MFRVHLNLVYLKIWNRNVLHKNSRSFFYKKAGIVAKRKGFAVIFQNTVREFVQGDETDRYRRGVQGVYTHCQISVFQ